MKNNIPDIDSIISIAKDAGKAILLVYNNKNFKVQIKSDNSPLTEADLISNEILTNGLKKISSIPIISEEEAKAMNPDYYLVLPWHFKHSILPREKEFLLNGGKFIFPFPEIEIV